MSSCFFSSREKIRISLMSLFKKRRRTALPKLPVPPVINKTLSWNTDIIGEIIISYRYNISIVLQDLSTYRFSARKYHTATTASYHY